VCKDPQRTRTRKAALVSEDIINTQRVQLTQGVREEEEESPVAAIPRRVYPGFQSAAKAVLEPTEDHRSDPPILLPSPPAHAMKRPRDEHDDPVTGPNRPLKILKAETTSQLRGLVQHSRFQVQSVPRGASSSTLTGTGVKKRTVFYGNIPKREPKPRVKEPDVDLETDERGYHDTTCTGLRRSRKLPNRCDPAYLSKNTATPDDMPSDNETLDISFSQKIPVSSHDVALLYTCLHHYLSERFGKRP
jgi:hypothetical protein